MTFLVDNQLPLQLARHLEGLGHYALHVVDVGLDEADDSLVWARGIQERRVVIGKDEDFFFLPIGRTISAPCRGSASATVEKRPCSRPSIV